MSLACRSGAWEHVCASALEEDSWLLCQPGADNERGEVLLSSFARSVILDDGGDLWEIQPPSRHVSAHQHPSLAAGELQEDMCAYALHPSQNPVASCMRFDEATDVCCRADRFACVSLQP